MFALSILQLVGVAWIYGLENFCWDMEFMLGRKVTPYWRISWGFVTPVFMILIFVYSMITLENPTYASLQFPDEAILFGWLIFTVGASQVIIWFLWVVSYNSESTNRGLLQKIQKGFAPSDEWGPKNSKQREEWLRFKSDAIEKRNITIERENHSWMQQKLYLFTGKYRNI